MLTWLWKVLWHKSIDVMQYAIWYEYASIVIIKIKIPYYKKICVLHFY